MKNKIEIPIGDKFIVVEAYKADPEIPTEITTYIRDKDGIILQDICLVREHYDVSSCEIKTDNKSVDCIIWGDSGLEDFTDKIQINLREDD